MDESRPIEIKNGVVAPQLILRKFEIPHEGDIIIKDDGNLEIYRKQNYVQPTIIPKEEGIIYDYREFENDRISRIEKIKKVGMENAVPIAINLVKATAV